MSTLWLMVCRWPQSQEGDWARPHLCNFARHGTLIRPETVQQRPCMTREIQTWLSPLDTLPATKCGEAFSNAAIYPPAVCPSVPCPHSKRAHFGAMVSLYGYHSTPIGNSLLEVKSIGEPRWSYGHK